MYSLAVISMLLFCVCYDNYPFSLIPCFLFFFLGEVTASLEQLMFCGSGLSFCKLHLFYYDQRFKSIPPFRFFSDILDNYLRKHRYHTVLLVCSYRILTSSVIYFRTNPQQHGIYFFYIMKKQKLVDGDVIHASVLQSR